MAETNLTPKALSEKIVKILDVKKAGNIKLLFVHDKTVLADYFVLCTGNSNTQIRALANEVEFKIGESDGIHPAHIDGIDDSKWVVLDYSSVIVHVFGNDTRSFYNLEKLWADAEDVDISGIIEPEGETQEKKPVSVVEEEL